MFGKNILMNIPAKGYFTPSFLFPSGKTDPNPNDNDSLLGISAERNDNDTGNNNTEIINQTDIQLTEIVVPFLDISAENNGVIFSSENNGGCEKLRLYG